MKYALIGGDLSYTYSQMIHNFLGYEYDLVVLKHNELSSFILAKDFKGINITNPYKQIVLPYCDSVSEYVCLTKSTNTIINNDGRLSAYNTDTSGFIYTLHRAGIKFEGRKVMIMGEGATSRSVRLASKFCKARQIIHVGRKSSVNYQNCYDQNDTNVIVNATPVGTFPNNGEVLVDLKQFPHLEAVVDVVYNPLRTPLLIQAERLGLKTSSGLPMLAAQAKRSSELFRNDKLPSEVIEDIIEYISDKVLNIVLIGMPGCGKTTIGRMLSEKLQKTFLDTDELIKLNTGKSPEQIIKNNGESSFRKTERKTLYSLLGKKGNVISLGGGAIISKTACEALKQHSFVVYLHRDLSLLDEDKRPVLQRMSKQKLYEERKAAYESLADVKINNTGSFDTVIFDIIKAYKDFIRSNAL